MSYKVRAKIVALSIISALLFGVFVPANIVNATSGDTIVYITKSGECYHTSGCSSLRKSKIETTLQNAVDKGLRPCSKCKPGSLDATSTTSTASSQTVSKTTTTKAATTTTVVDPAIEALKTYKGNTKEFNAYAYYINNADLQTAIGADGDKLLKHYNEYGKAEGRKAK